MERFVIKWSHGDGCTYNCDETEPVLFESGEAFLVAFEELVMKAHAAQKGDFDFAGRTWQVDHFYVRGFYSGTSAYYAPDVLTVDEWFAQ